MGLVIAVVVRFIRTGIWSDVVIGPGLISVLCTALLLDTTMSGVDVLVLLKKVGKLGPRCMAFPLFIKVLSALPTLLLVLFPRDLCLAFKSPVIYEGWLLCSALCISGNGRYGLLGGRYVVAIDMVPMGVSILSSVTSVIKSSIILCLICDLISIAERTPGWSYFSGKCYIP